jgi:Fe2+ transport system protein B
MTSRQKLIGFVVIAIAAAWFIKPNSNKKKAAQEESPVQQTLKIPTVPLAQPTQEELDQLQEEHLSRLDSENPFTVEYTYPRSENLSEEEVAQYEAQRMIESRWEQIRAYNEGELPYVTEEDKIIAAELMREEGLTSIYESQP